MKRLSLTRPPKKAKKAKPPKDLQTVVERYIRARYHYFYALHGKPYPRVHDEKAWAERALYRAATGCDTLQEAFDHLEQRKPPNAAP